MIQKLLNQIEMYKEILCTKKLSIYSQERIVCNIMELEDQVIMIGQLTLEAGV